MRHTDIPDGPTLTVTEAALLLRVHRATIRRWIEEGRLPAWQAKRGGVIRLSRRAVEALTAPDPAPEQAA